MATNEQLQATLAALSGSAPKRATKLTGLPKVKPKPQAQENRSLLGQLGQVLSSAPKGLAHLAKDVGVTALAPIRLGADSVKNVYDDVTNQRSVDWNPFDDKGGALASLEKTQREYAPVIADQTDSFLATGSRLANPSKYGQAIDDGTILATVLEDLGNVTIVGSAAAKGATAGLGRAASAAESVGQTGKAASLARAAEVGTKVQKTFELGGKIADSPVSLPAKGISSAAKAVGGPTLAKLVDVAPGTFSRFTPEGKKILKDADRLGRMDPTTANTRVVRAIEEATTRSDLTDVEQNAAIGVFTGEASRLQAILDRNPDLAADPAGFAQVVNDTFALQGQRISEGHSFTPEAAQLALDALQDPQGPTARRLAPLTAALDQTYKGLEEMARDPEARATPLTRENWTDLDATVLTELRRSEAGANALNRIRREWQDAQDILEADRARHPGPRPLGADRPKTVPLSELEAKFDQYAEEYRQSNPDAAPIKLADAVDMNNPASFNPEWRRAATDLQRYNTALQRQLDDALERGDDLAAEEIMARAEAVADISTPRGLVENSTANYTPGQSLVDMGPTINPADVDPYSQAGTTVSGSEKMTSGVTPTPHTATGQAKVAAAQAELLTRNKGFVQLVKKHGRTVRALLGDEMMNDFIAQAKAVDADQGLRGVDFASELHRLIATEMDARGYEAWPTPNRDGRGYAVNLKRDRVARASEETIFMPKGLKKIVADRMKIGGPPKALKILDTTNSAFKRLTLPLSVTWHIGDAISNVMFAAARGGVNPLDMARGMTLTKQLMDTDGGASLMNHIAAASDAGSLSYSDHLNWLEQEARAKGLADKRANMGRARLAASRAATPLRVAQDAGFKLNRTINDLQRSGYKIIQLDRALRNLKDADGNSLGLSAEGIALADPAILKRPEIAKAIEEVVDQANDVFGTTPLTPFERNYIKPLVPFYHWIKTINTFAVKMAAEHPARALWMLNLGNMAADDREMPGFLEGAFETPWGYMSLNSLNPFADIGGGLTSPQAALRSLAPGVKLAAAAGFGVDLNKGGRPLTTSDDLQSAPDEYGNRDPEALWRHPGALLGYTAGLTPVTRAVRNVLPNISLPTGLDLGAGARYGSSEVITQRSGDRLGADRNWVTDLPALAGIRFPFPQYSQEEVDQINASSARRRRLANINR